MKAKDKLKKKSPKMAGVDAIIREAYSSSHTDPSGSYTGHPKDPNDVPTQDADDL